MAMDSNTEAWFLLSIFLGAFVMIYLCYWCRKVHVRTAALSSSSVSIYNIDEERGILDPPGRRRQIQSEVSVERNTNNVFNTDTDPKDNERIQLIRSRFEFQHILPSNDSTKIKSQQRQQQQQQKPQRIEITQVAFGQLTEMGYTLKASKKALRAVGGSDIEAAVDWLIEHEHDSPKAVEQPPRGVPIIKRWEKRSDGSLSGLIYGSPTFEDGDFVETSKIMKGKIKNGSVVSTKSKNRYFLIDSRIQCDCDTDSMHHSVRCRLDYLDSAHSRTDDIINNVKNNSVPRRRNSMDSLHSQFDNDTIKSLDSAHSRIDGIISNMKNNRVRRRRNSMDSSHSQFDNDTNKSLDSAHSRVDAINTNTNTDSVRSRRNSMDSSHSRYDDDTNKSTDSAHIGTDVVDTNTNTNSVRSRRNSMDSSHGRFDNDTNMSTDSAHTRTDGIGNQPNTNSVRSRRISTDSSHSRYDDDETNKSLRSPSISFSHPSNNTGTDHNKSQEVCSICLEPYCVGDTVARLKKKKTEKEVNHWFHDAVAQLKRQTLRRNHRITNNNSNSNTNTNNSHNGNGNDSFWWHDTVAQLKEATENSNYKGKSCDHWFHEECILGWLENHDECPLCRIDMIHDD